MPNLSPCPPIALTIAGSDSGGGAGIQADLRTFAAFGVHGLSAITALTAQNTRGVRAIQMARPAMLRAQIEAVFDDFGIGAVKSGMLGTPTLVRTIAEVLRAQPQVRYVLDPVLIATTGAALARGGVTQAILRHLLPLATVVTPNVPEAEQLLGCRIRDAGELADAAHALQARGARAVLLKGGHLPGATVCDLLLDADGGQHRFEHPRIAGEGHGTGCSLAAAVAAGLARGAPLATAVADATGFVHRALAGGYRPGRGEVVVLDHLGAQAPRR